MANNAIETVMGAVVLAVAGSFLYFAYSNSSVKPIDGYVVNASFSNIGGITPGSSVRVGGIKVGVVEKLTLDPKNFRAVASMRVGNDIALPKDSAAAVQSSGLLGEKFIAIEPGGDDANLANGDTIAFTQPSVNIEEMIGKFMFSGGGADKGGKPDAAPAASASAAPVASLGLSDDLAPAKDTKPKDSKPAAKEAKETKPAPKAAEPEPVKEVHTNAPAGANVVKSVGADAPAGAKEPAPASAQ